MVTEFIVTVSVSPVELLNTGLDISACPLAQGSVKAVGRVQITDHSPGLASTIFSFRINY